MITFLIRRLIGLVAVLFCVVTITFFLIRLSPGGPFDAERKIPPAIEKQLLAKYKLDGPLWQQYAGYLGDLVRGDLRDSTKYRNRSVAEILAQTLPVTMTLGVLAFGLAVAGGTVLGVAAAAAHGTWKDTLAMLLALAAISLPAFIIGPVLILIFSFWLHWLPVGGWGSPSAIVLPAITLAAPYVGLHRATAARQHDGDAWAGLYSDRAGQRPRRTVGALPPCPASRNPSSRFIPGSLGGTFANRLDRCRDHLLHSGRRWIFCELDSES